MNRAVMKYEDYQKFKVGNLVTLTSFSSNQVGKVNRGICWAANTPREAPLSGMIVRFGYGDEQKKRYNSLDVLIGEDIWRFYMTNNLQVELKKP